MAGSSGACEVTGASVTVVIEAESVDGWIHESFYCAPDVLLENIVVVWCGQHAFALQKVKFYYGEYELSPADTPMTMKWLECESPVIVKARVRRDTDAAAQSARHLDALVGDVVSVHGSDSEMSGTQSWTH